jgi:nucleotide-binding universal stress UspA family protein
MRTYLVVIDETEEAETALRFAARRAAKTGGAVEVLVIIPPDNFIAWGGVQATMREEALEHAEAVVARGLDMLGEEGAVRPEIKVREGAAVAVIREALTENPEIGALVLGAAKAGNPGPLVSQFAGMDAGTLPCALMIVPGALSRDALDRLS